MPIDLPAWRKLIEQVLDEIADESQQRRAWFGQGPEVSSPDEMFNQRLDDAAPSSVIDKAKLIPLL